MYWFCPPPECVCDVEISKGEWTLLSNRGVESGGEIMTYHIHCLLVSVLLYAAFCNGGRNRRGGERERCLYLDKSQQERRLLNILFFFSND